MALTSASTFDLSTTRDNQHGPFGERVLAVRGPRSLSSRSSTTRRHRSRRSHGGHLPSNEFPNFALSGDVEIVVAADGQERRYVLHRLILAQCSGFFEASLSEEWSRATRSAPAGGNMGAGALARIGEESDGDQTRASLETARPKKMWRYELDWGPEGRSEDIPMLVQKPAPTSLFGGDPAPKPPSSRNKPPASSTGLFRSISAMQSALTIPRPPADAESDTIRDYDNLFRIFYNYPPQLDGVDITEAYIQCKMLLNLADMYDALEVVGPRIDHHLLQFQARLWKQIAKYPPSYLKLGYLARSRSIFAEALVHVVGQWPLGAAQLRSVPEAVRELVEDKAADLDDLQLRIEHRLLRLALAKTGGPAAPPTTTAAHSLDWSAAALFRSWVADNTAPAALLPPPAPSAPNAPPLPTAPPAPAVARPAAAPSGPARAPARAFRLLGQGGPAYLPHDECKRLVRAFVPEPYSRDLLRRFERRMDDLKAQAREIVRPLLRQGLQLEMGGGAAAGITYLTCTRVEEGEWPW